MLLCMCFRLRALLKLTSLPYMCRSALLPHPEWLNAKGKRLSLEDKQQGSLAKTIQQELEWINKK